MKKLLILLAGCLALCAGALADTSAEVRGGDGAQSAPVLAAGGEYLCAMQGQSTQWFAIESEDDSTFYAVTLTNIDYNYSVSLQLCDKDGAVVHERGSIGVGDTFWLSAKAPAGERLYAVVTGRESGSSGNFRLRVEAHPDAEADAPEGASELTGEVYGSIDGLEDVDVFAYRTGENPTYVTLTGSNIDIGNFLRYRVLDAENLEIYTRNAYTNASESGSFRLEPNSTYYLSAYSEDAYCLGRYGFAIEAREDIYGDDAQSAFALTSGQRIDSAIEGPGDVDVFGFTAAGGEAFYRLTLNNLDVNDFLYLRVMDVHGQVVAEESTYQGEACTVDFKPAGAGEYCVSIAVNGSNFGSYAFSIEEGSDAEGDAAADAVPLAADVPYMGALEWASDVDCFSVTTGDVPAWQVVSIENIDATSGVRLRATSADGQLMEEVTVYSQGDVERLWWRTDAVADCTLAVAAYQNGALGGYQLAWQTVEDAPGETAETAAPILPGETATQAIDVPGDVDFFSLEAMPAARSVGVSVDASADGRTISIQAVDGYGRILTEAYAYGERTSFVVEQPADEAMYIRVSGSDACAYTLTLCTGETHIPSGEWEETRAADCINPGERVCNCLVCGQPVVTEAIPALGHEPGEWQVEVAADCVNDGSEVALCTRCREVADRRTLAATGHHEVYWEVEVEPACETDGIQRQVCPYCNQILARERIACVGHIAPESFSVAVAPSCEGEGVAARICTVCGAYVEQKAIAPTGHRPGSEVLEVEGERCAVCEVCGAIVPVEEAAAEGQ